MKTAITLAAALMIALAGAPSVVHAQSAEALLQEGLELRRQGRDTDALTRFEAAYRMGQSAQALAQIALAEQAIGHFAAAETHLSTAIQIRNDPWISTRLPQLQQALQSIQAQLGTIEIQGAPDGAVVYINGEARGEFPGAGRQRVRAGTVVIEVQAQGYAAVQRQIDVQAGGTWRENVAMVQVQAQVQVGVQREGDFVTRAEPQAGAVYQQPRQQVISRPNWKLFGAGVGVFAGLWLLTGLVSLAVEDEDYQGLGFIPVAGPFIFLDGLDSEDPLFTILVLDGVLQIVGIAGAVIGLVIQQEEVVMALGDDPRAPVLAVEPGVAPILGLGETGLGGVARNSGGQSVGLTLELTHF